MYKRILLAYDGSLEGRAALREGTLLAKLAGSQVYLLSVIAESPGVRMAEGAHAGASAHRAGAYQGVFDEAVEALRSRGLNPVAKLVWGEPTEEIAAFAKEVSADLVVVGHRKQGLVQRWWSGSSGSYLMDHLKCSLLIGRTSISHEEFLNEMEHKDAAHDY